MKVRDGGVADDGMEEMDGLSTSAGGGIAFPGGSRSEVQSPFLRPIGLDVPSYLAGRP